MQHGSVSARPVAIVTGALRGIGRGCGVALAQSGFQILLNDRDDDASNGLFPALIDELAALGAEGEFFPSDIANLATHAPLADAAMKRWGRLDCLVNNAGISVLRRGDLLDVEPDSFDRCINVNTRAAFFLSQTVARHMLKQGPVGDQHRSIINITSSNAVSVSITRGEYCVSKCASSMTTKLFALRLADTGIGVYEIQPGIIETDMTKPSKEKYDALIAGDLVPAHRLGFPADVASTVCCMAEGRLRYTTGLAIAVDGGLTMPHY